jgi:hypothetical protein
MFEIDLDPAVLREPSAFELSRETFEEQAASTVPIISAPVFKAWLWLAATLNVTSGDCGRRLPVKSSPSENLLATDGVQEREPRVDG